MFSFPRLKLSLLSYEKKLKHKKIKVYYTP